MKNVLLLITFILTIRGNAQTQNLKTASSNSNTYKPILQETFDAFEKCNDFNQRINLSNKLALIAGKWQDEWITHYYVAYSKAILSSQEKDDTKRDAYLNEADKEHDKAVKLLGKENDETYVLGALIANWRIAISPMMRSGKYATIFRQDMENAKKINPDNPRIYHLEGMAKFSMPKFVGGGKDAALPFLKKADSLYSGETSNDIQKPYWGKEKNSYYLSLCKKS